MKSEIISWVARVICILAIAFVMMFSADCFGGGLKLSEQLICFFMHNIPAYILIVLLIIAWRWQMVGGLIFVLIALISSPWLFMHNYAMNHSVIMSLSVLMVISFPFFVVGLLFLWSIYLKNKVTNSMDDDVQSSVDQ